jgi:Flp pilus assembly protein TadD
MRALLVVASTLCVPAIAKTAWLTAQSAIHARSSATDRATQLAGSGRIDEAIRLLESAVAVQPKDSNAWLLLGTLYAEIRNDEKAEKALQGALRTDPKSVSAAIALGSLYISSKSWNSAEAVFTEALRHHPAQPELRIQLATVLAAERRYKEAQSAIRQVPLPTDLAAQVRYLRLAASIHSGLGESQAAARCMEEALQRMPHDEGLQLLTAVTEAQARDWKSCLRNIAPLYASHPTPSTGILLLQAELGSNTDYEATLHDLDSMALPPSQELQLKSQSAAILSSAGKHSEAEEQFREALKIQGGRDETLAHNLAVEQFTLGESDNALSTLEPMRVNHDSGEIEDLIGDIEERKGDRAASIQSHRNAIRLAPDDEDFRLSLGAELLKYHAYEDALLIFQQAAKLFPNSARVFVGLGMANNFLENYDESASEFLHADQLDGNSGRALGYLGSTQMEIPTGPTQSAVDAVCTRAASHSAEAIPVSWCGALLFRRAYLADDKSVAPDVIKHLRLANRLAPANALTNCYLGQALQWSGQMTEARHWLEICVKLRPESAEDHYHLRQLYQALGLTEAAAEQAALTAKANSKQDQMQEITDHLAEEIVGSQRPTPLSK